MKVFKYIKSNVSLQDLLSCLKSPLFLIGLLISIFVWLIDPIIDAEIFGQGTFRETLLNPNSHEIYIRSCISVLILFYSFVAALTFKKLKSQHSELARVSSMLKKVTSASQDLIFVKDNNLRTIFCNEAFAKSLGKVPGEFYGKTDIENGWDPDFVLGNPEKGIRGYMQDDKKVLAGEIIRNSSEPVGMNNEVRFYDTIKAPIHNDTGVIIGVLGISRDITERLQSERALLHSEERYRKLIEETTSIVWTTDESGGFSTPQLSWEKFTGQPWEKHKGFGWKNALHPEDVDCLLESWKNACKEKCYFENNGRIWNKEYQQWRDFEVKATPIIDTDGSLREWIGIIHDTTKQKQTEKSVRDSEEKFRAIYESTDVGIAMCNMEGTLVEMNKGFLNIIGYTEDEASQLSYWDLTPEDYKDKEQKQLDSLNQTGKYGPYEKEYIHSNGNRVPVLLSGMIIDDASGEQRIWSIVQDISHLKEMEHTIRESNERFKASFNDAPIGMALVALDHSIIEANQSFSNMLGYQQEELTGIHFKDITHQEDVEKSIEQHKKLIDNELDHYSFEKRYIHKQGHEVWGALSVSLVRDDKNSPVNAIAQIQDITERKEANDLLTYQASHDALTGLVNRREFERRAERLLKTNQKEIGGQHALCFMDLDQFKIVNDTCGHNAGDEMLRQISAILQCVIRHRDTLARLGGDEFGVLMEYCSLDDAHRVVTSLQKAVQDYIFSWESHSFIVGVSIGLVPITENVSSLTELLRQADAACYMAKDKGRNRIHVYHAEDSEIAKRHGEMQWVERLYKALDKNLFSLYAQAIVPLNDNNEVHYELLIRMKNDQGELIPPNAFLPAAERYNLISRIDLWVIEKTFSLLQNNKHFLNQINFCSINLSGASLSDSNILDIIITKLNEHKIDGNKICFEITETAAILNMKNATHFISTLKNLGCHFALDDFGSGLSSFAYLKILPVDYLKIDGMFVKDIVADPIDLAMVKSINEIGQVMGMQTIAEFVENDVIKGILKEIGVNYAQGYGIEKPKPFEELLQQSNNVIDINKNKGST
jgi:diguanylate cyclase (GGDEF)-like protein/PAS domain S-box-containing protein